ncbi:MAG: GTP-binding protein [Pseudonocardiaceae bacterium]|nr:GTP-binding protein [Pseudonocardiaceae bacterium]
MRNRRIPVLIVAGFLGSGKTTLLNHLLTNNAGARIGVLVNDFGSINIDAMAVAGQVDSTLTLGNGCLCCAVDASGMDALLERLARPGAELDLIVVEASGLAEPREMIRMVLSATNPNIEFGGLVEVVDTVEFEGASDRHPSLERHLAFADLIVLNKTDRVDAARRERMTRTVQELAGGAPVLPVSYGRIPTELLVEPRSAPATARVAEQLSFDQLRDDRAAGPHEPHLHAEYHSAEFACDEPLNPRALMRFLDDRPAGLYRLKGFVYFGVTGHKDKFTLHTVGTHLRVHRSRWSQGEQRRTQLVMIGSGIDAEDLTTKLRHCVETEPHQVDQQAILPILRHV